MTSDDFRCQGQALHGRHWISALAYDLGMSRTSIEHYANGERRIPCRVEQAMHKMLVKKRLELDRMLVGLSK